jgi:hypothetical protein
VSAILQAAFGFFKTRNRIVMLVHIHPHYSRMSFMKIFNAAISRKTLSTASESAQSRFFLADSFTGDKNMANHEEHVKILDKKITELSDALAHLGKGTDLKELLRIIRFPGYTTPAELAFSVAIIDSMSAQTRLLSTLNTQLLAAGKLVIAK